MAASGAGMKLKVKDEILKDRAGVCGGVNGLV